MADIKEIKIEIFTGEHLYDRETNVESLIEGYLWERDVVMLLGSEKSGKSIIAMQMACALSTGGLFLGKYQCKKSAVYYLQLEGKKDETAKRLKDMSKAVSIEKDYFIRAYKKFLPLDIDDYAKALDKQFDSLEVKPQVIVIDCLYMAMTGDLNNNEHVRKFIQCLSWFLEKHKLTCILVHHARKEEMFEGKTVQVGDKISYGSVFLRANVDHIIFLDMQKDKSRMLSCETQRSGRVSEKESLVLVQPTPLFFKIKDQFTSAEESILENLKLGRMTKQELIETLGYAESTIRASLTKLIVEGRANIVDEKKGDRGSPEKVYGIIKKMAEMP